MTGADNTAAARALSPLHAFDFQECELSAWRGDTARCRWCDQPLRRGRLYFCSRDHQLEAIRNHAWPSAKKAAKARDRRCVRCGGKRFLQVHHRTPCKGVRTFSCLHHLDGLETLCWEPGCHRAADKEARAAAA